MILASAPALAYDDWNPFQDETPVVRKHTSVKSKNSHKKHKTELVEEARNPLNKRRVAKQRERNPLADIPIIGQIFQSGTASFYHEPQALASGGRFNPEAMTAAHRTLPFGTRVRVTNKRNGKSVVVTINDRGPYIGGRIIDLSKGAARVIGMLDSGVAPVTVEKV